MDILWQGDVVQAMLWAVAGVCALIYLALTTSEPSWPRSVIKTLPLVLFAVIAWRAEAPVLLALGFAFSALGDWALSREGERAFLVGLIGFAIAHILYIVVFASEIEIMSLWPLVILLPLALSTEVWLTPHTGAMRQPVRAYVLIICTMAILAANLPPDRHLATLGAGMFLSSDLILSIRLFRLSDDHPMARPAAWALWALYVGGQALILFAYLAQ